MSDQRTGCGFWKGDDGWFCVIHQCWAEVPDLCPLNRAEAAIARVRGVCADQCFWAEHGPDAGLVNAVTVESILNALEGGSDD